MLEDDLSVTLMRLGLATLLGLVLGFERERHGHDAGLRTHGLGHIPINRIPKASAI